MADLADELFEDESVAADEAAVDDVILRAGGERQAIRALLVQLAEREAQTSTGYRRGRQPARRLS